MFIIGLYEIEAFWCQHLSLHGMHVLCYIVLLIHVVLRRIWLLISVDLAISVDIEIKRIENIWAVTRENLAFLHPNNKGTDQPMHLRSLISTFVYASCKV